MVRQGMAGWAGRGPVGPGLVGRGGAGYGVDLITERILQ